MMRLARAGEEIPLTVRARCKWDAGKAIDWSVQAVDKLFEASGGRGIFLDNPIQRAWRDVHAMRAHAGNNPERAAFVFTRSEFGLPPRTYGSRRGNADEDEHRPHSDDPYREPAAPARAARDAGGKDQGEPYDRPRWRG